MNELMQLAHRFLQNFCLGNQSNQVSSLAYYCVQYLNHLNRWQPAQGICHGNFLTFFPLHWTPPPPHIRFN
jgi:hypothetical protein